MAVRQVIAVLGGGVGGLVAANELRRLLPDQHRIVLVEKDLRHAFAPSFLWVMVGDRRPEQAVRDLRTLVRPGVEIVNAEVDGMDLDAGRVDTTVRPLKYDHLIIALGAELAPQAIPGLAEAADTFYTWDGSRKLHETLRAFPESGGTVAIVVSAVPYKCPGAPHEGAMLIGDYFRRRGLAGKVQIHLCTPEAQPMPVAGPVLGEAVTEMLRTRGVEFHPLHKLVRVEVPPLPSVLRGGLAKRVLFFEGLPSVVADLVIAVPPHRSPKAVREAGLTNETGWVPVDRTTRRTRSERVYAIGDVTAIPLPGRWKPDVPLMLPKAGVFAHAQGLVIARRIAAEVKAGLAPPAFDGYGYCMLEAGEAMGGFAFGDFFAEPSPRVEIRQVGRSWHWGKVLFEKWWLTPPGLRREGLRLALAAGASWLRIPATL